MNFQFRVAICGNPFTNLLGMEKRTRKRRVSVSKIPSCILSSLTLSFSSLEMSSLEEQLASLTLADVPALVALVQKDVDALAANASVLAARCDSADEAEALAALAAVEKLAVECPQAQAFTKECLSACTCQWKGFGTLLLGSFLMYFFFFALDRFATNASQECRCSYGRGEDGLRHC